MKNKNEQKLKEKKVYRFFLGWKHSVPDGASCPGGGGLDPLRGRGAGVPPGPGAAPAQDRLLQLPRYGRGY